MAEIRVLTVAPKTKEHSFSPFVNIYLSSHSTDSDGRNLLSPELMTDEEIDETVNQLIGQLEKARKKAKKELRKVKTRL